MKTGILRKEAAFGDSIGSSSHSNQRNLLVKPRSSCLVRSYTNRNTNDLDNYRSIFDVVYGAPCMLHFQSVLVDCILLMKS